MLPSIALPTWLLASILAMVLGAIALVALNDAPEAITVTERVSEGLGPSLLAVDEWQLEGSGTFGHAPTEGPGAARELRIANEPGAVVGATLAMDPAARGILRTVVLPEEAGTVAADGCTIWRWLFWIGDKLGTASVLLF